MKEHTRWWLATTFAAGLVGAMTASDVLAQPPTPPRFAAGQSMESTALFQPPQPNAVPGVPAPASQPQPQGNQPTEQLPTPPRLDEAARSAPGTAVSVAQPGLQPMGAPATCHDGCHTLAYLTLGGALAIAGRADQNNRLNLFDNQTALPQTRAWYTIKYLDNYYSGLGFAEVPGITTEQLRQVLAQQGYNPRLIDRGNELLHRAAIEWAVLPTLSFTLQGQYLSMNDIEGPTEGWTNPQFVAKYAAYQEHCLTISALLAYQPAVHEGFLLYNDDAHALYPGMLFFWEPHCKCFIQGGWQVRVPLEKNAVFTFDYVGSAGWWLYRSPELDGAFGCGGASPFIRGIVPQIEIYGKHVIGDASIFEPFGIGPIFYPDRDTGQIRTAIPYAYEEPRHVFDVTLAGKVLLKYNTTITGGMMLPLTGKSVAQQAFFLTVNVNF